MLLYSTKAFTDALDGRQDFSDHLGKSLVVLVGFGGMCILVITLQVLLLARCTRTILVAFGLTLTASIASLWIEIKNLSTKVKKCTGLPDWRAYSSYADLDLSYAWSACTVDSILVDVGRKDPAWDRLCS